MLKILVLSAALVLASWELVWAEDKEVAQPAKEAESLQTMERLLAALCAAVEEGGYEDGRCRPVGPPEMQVPAPYYSGTADGT